MTLGAEEEKQFHSRFPFFRSPVPSSPSSDIVLFLFYFFVRHSSPMHHACDPTRTGTRTKNASCPWPPRSRDDCNLHKLSFRFDDDIVEATAVKKWIENDWRIEFFALRTLDRHDTTSRVSNKKDEEPFYIFYLHLDYLRDMENQSEIKARSNINTSRTLEIQNLYKIY